MNYADAFQSTRAGEAHLITHRTVAETKDLVGHTCIFGIVTFTQPFLFPDASGGRIVCVHTFSFADVHEFWPGSGAVLDQGSSR
jgi:hypothetical protein